MHNTTVLAMVPARDGWQVAAMVGAPGVKLLEQFANSTGLCVKLRSNFQLAVHNATDELQLAGRVQALHL